MRFGNPECWICSQVHPVGEACDGWLRSQGPTFGDCRKLVTLEKAGMTWVGIRAFDGKKWVNNGQPEKDRVVAWRDLPEPAAHETTHSGGDGHGD